MLLVKGKFYIFFIIFIIVKIIFLLVVFIIVMFFKCRFIWIDNIIIKSLLINGLDIGWYFDINGVIKMIVYKVSFNNIVWFFKC